VANWLAALRADPLEWLLEPRDPAVRHLALQQLLVLTELVIVAYATPHGTLSTAQGATCESRDAA
jgi:hypothetical protein